MAVVGRWTGLETRALRLALRMTWEAFAERIGASVRTIANWESRGATATPQLDMQAALDTLLHRADPAVMTRFEALLRDPPKADEHDQVERGKGPGVRPRRAASGSRIGVDLVAVAELRQQVEDLDARYDRQPSASLLPEAGTWLGQVAALRTEVTSARVHRALSAVEAEAATLMGQLVWDASQRRDHATARTYFGQAIAAARQIGDRTAEGYALLRTSFVALYGEKDPQAGLDLAVRAAHTSASTSAVIASLAILHVAEAYAMLGQRQDCERALGRARSIGDTVEVSDPMLDLLPTSQQDRIAGSCYLALGAGARAIGLLEQAATALAPGSKSHALVLANIALAQVRERDLDGAVEALHRALDAVQVNRGGGALNVVFQAGRELQPWRHTAQAQNVHDRLLALIAAA
jgi:transcriptional regulator with XRE-family HTH domain